MYLLTVHVLFLKCILVQCDVIIYNMRYGRIKKKINKATRPNSSEKRQVVCASSLLRPIFMLKVTTSSGHSDYNKGGSKLR